MTCLINRLYKCLCLFRNEVKAWCQYADEVSGACAFSNVRGDCAYACLSLFLLALSSHGLPVIIWKCVGAQGCWHLQGLHTRLPAHTPAHVTGTSANAYGKGEVEALACFSQSCGRG